MPQYRNPFEKGDLYVKFDVQFPENNWISAEKLNVSRDDETFAHFETPLSLIDCCLMMRSLLKLISFRNSSACCLLALRILSFQQMQRKST